MLQQMTKPSREQLERIQAYDWDILLILDACRYDTFEELISVPVEPVRSHASATPQWLRTSYDAGVFDDVNVVTANPQYQKVDCEFENANLEYIFETEWNNQLNTVLPGPVLDHVETVLDRSDQHVIGHLVQPHWPYIQQLGDVWLPAMDTKGIGVVGRSAQVAMANGDFDPELARKAYRSSVSSLWKAIAPWVGEMADRGYKLAITADHGEVFGRLREAKLYEHPSRIHIRPLTEVPWVEIESGTDVAVDSETEEKLRALGYA
jgi:hypothetical protein